MKQIKIFALPSHATKDRHSGVDFARVLQPMEHLNGYSEGEVEFKVDIYDPNVDEMDSSPQTWINIAQKYDILYFNYLNNPWGFAAMGSMMRGYGKKMVMDLDDSLWNIQTDNSAYEVYKPSGQPIRDFTSICNEVDYLTCTNDYLKHVIMNNTSQKADKIKVFPNYINLDLYSHKSPFKNDGRIRLLHYGSSTHYIDLQTEEFGRGIDRVLKAYPNVTIKMVGAFIPSYRNRWGLRYENGYGHEDIYKWAEGRFRGYMDEADIMVVPLKDNIYNRCKSSIKFIESSSAAKPGIWQDIRQYSEVVVPGENGYLASTSGDWYNAISTMINDPDLRQKVREGAYKTVTDSWQIKDHIKKYADFFKSVIDQ